MFTIGNVANCASKVSYSSLSKHGYSMATGRMMSMRHRSCRINTYGVKALLRVSHHNNPCSTLRRSNPIRCRTFGSRTGASAAADKPAVDDPSFLTMFGIGLAGGSFGAIMGLAGGVVIVPAIVTFTSVSQKSAIGTSLVAALVVGSVGCANYAKEGLVDFVNAIVIATGSSITAGVGARFAQGLPDRTLKTVLGIYMIAMAMIVPARDALLKTLWPKDEAAPLVDDTKARRLENYGELDVENMPVFFMTGLFAGFASGLFGIAGGTIVTPTLAVFTSLTQPQVLGTSLTAGIMPTILAARSYYKNGFVIMKAVPAITVGAAVGATIGSRVALMLSDEHLRLCFSGGMVALGLRVLISRK